MPDSVGENEANSHPMHWPHAPAHQLSDAGTYFVSAGTYRKQHHFQGAARLGVLCRGLLSVCHEVGWKLEAWAVFSNHYHFVAHSPTESASAESMKSMLAKLHFKTASWVNRLDGERGRKVWFNYRETQLTYDRSFLARLSYVHQNAVHHGLVSVASDYPWCSAGWLERSASDAQIRTIYSFKSDRIHLYDDYDVSRDW